MRMTMGAMRRFKQETGMEVSEMTTEASLMVVFLFCCVASACNADNVPFDLDLDKFADGLEMDKLTDFVETMQQDAGDSKKEDGSASIEELTGIAVGSIGMSLMEFCHCTPHEFFCIYKSWEQTRMREPWERTRFLACCVLQPYSKKR